MAKLTSDAIKGHFCEYLKEDLKKPDYDPSKYDPEKGVDFSEYCMWSPDRYFDRKDTEEEIVRTLEFLADDIHRDPKTLTVQEAKDILTKLWTSPKEWVRGEKCRYEAQKEEEYVNFRGVLVKQEVELSFDLDCGGELDEVAVAEALKIWKDSGYDKKKLPWHRTFYPKSSFLADNYRCEVLTTHDDSKIIGWTIIVD